MAAPLGIATAARYPEAGNRLSAWAFRRALPAEAADAALVAARCRCRPMVG